MTREEAIKELSYIADEMPSMECADWIEAISMAIKALEQEPKMEEFAKWVANEIFDENWEYNKDAFEELACRKLAKLGIVRAKGNEWELIECKMQ